MIGTNRIKLVKALQIKKNRAEQSLFVVEGRKSVLEVLQSDWKVDSLYATDTFIEDFPQYEAISIRCSPADLAKMGSFQSNEDALAVVKMMDRLDPIYPTEGLHLALDSINDPGNLGTILRLADWYGVSAVWCSEGTVDLYNPKVIAASKGSFLRVKVYYKPLTEVFKQTTIPVMAAMLEGESIHKNAHDLPAILLIGNEAKGIDPELLCFITHTLHIPRFGDAESLNAAVATGILLDHLRRGSVKDF